MNRIGPKVARPIYAAVIKTSGGGGQENQGGNKPKDGSSGSGQTNKGHEFDKLQNDFK